MSRKWQRAKQWDERHLRGPMLRPIKWVAQSFSSIWLAVVLLSLVALYGVVASVPIGLLALIPTWLVIAASYAAPVLAGSAAAVLLARRVFRGGGARFAASLLGAGAVGTGVSLLWFDQLWPLLLYDPADGSGLRFFASFVEANSSTTVRRLPGLEMSELEFYSWWPMRLLLVLFVINMVTATVRRIEFTFKNIGVLTVHTGIVVIALGSVYYQALKKEGDTILLAAQDEGALGPPQNRFYDNTRTALWVRQERGGFNLGGAWEQRVLRGLPRYNAYDLDAAIDTAGLTVLGEQYRPIEPGVAAGRAGPFGDPGLSLDRPVPEGGGRVVDPDIRFRITGYAPYAEPSRAWGVRAEPSADRPPQPFRVVELATRQPEPGVELPEGAPPRVEFRFGLRPLDPAHRVSVNQLLAVEYRMGMPDERFGDLAEPVPQGTEHALVVRVPEAGLRTVIPARAGDAYEIADTGWTVAVREFRPEPPFPIITEGYEGATTSVAMLRITPPGGEPFDRYVYHHFPELNQDLSGGTSPDGRPVRSDPDPAIRVGYLDCSKLSVYFDEREDGRVRAIARRPGGGVRVEPSIEPGGAFEDAIPLIDFRLADRWADSTAIERPSPVPEPERDKSFVGTHDEAMVAVEVSVDGLDWRETVWLSHAKYMLPSMVDRNKASVTTPDGREVTLVFGRLSHRFPGFQLRLRDFEMVAYDHRGAPRDFQSVVRVEPSSLASVRGGGPGIDPFEHVTKLNDPLKAPYDWSERRGLASNVALTLFGGLNPGQFKLSQAGWDRSGWEQSQQLVDQGVLEEPRAAFTILGVGNNPGIHVIALGGVLVALGIPWAFYIKPWLVRRERDRLAARARSAGAAEGSGVASTGREAGDGLNRGSYGGSDGGPAPAAAPALH